jgi:hypothetical protein
LNGRFFEYPLDAHGPISPSSTSRNGNKPNEAAARTLLETIMRTTLTLAAILFAGAASAASVNQGQAQLAAQLGVPADQYTLSELTLLASERVEDGYGLTDNAPGLVDTSVSGGYNAGKAQLAAQLGLNANDYTLSELTKIDAHRTEYGVNKTEARTPSFTASAANPNNAGKLQLAAQLRVDPANYTLAELTKISSDRRGSDN